MKRPDRNVIANLGKDCLPRLAQGRNNRKNKGFTLIAVIFIIVIVIMISLATSSFISSQSTFSVDNYYSQKAFYIAEAGFQYYMKQLNTVADWTSVPSVGTVAFAGGTFQIAVSNQQKDQITIKSLASLTKGAKTYTRLVQYNAIRTVFEFSNDYVLYWGDGGGGSGNTLINNNVTINGDILTNSNLSFGTGNTVNGDVQSTGTISGSTSGVTGSVEPNASLPTNPPQLNTSYYDGQIAIAKTYAVGNQTWGSKTLTGTTYINGDLIVNGNLTITGSALVVTSGTVTFYNNDVIGNNFSLISDKLVTINNNVTFGSGCSLYSTVGFAVNNNFLFGLPGTNGGGSIITPGNFTSFWNNATIYGLIYVGGTLDLRNGTTFFGNIIAGNVASIGNNSVLTLSPTSQNVTNVPGMSGGYVNSVSGWSEQY